MNNNENKNLEFVDEDKPTDTSSRSIMAKKLIELNQLQNEIFEELNLHLEKKEDIYTDELKSHGINLLNLLSERINAIPRLNKILNSQNEEVLISDIELCEEFIVDSKLFSVTIKEFIETDTIAENSDFL